MTASGDQFGQL